MLPVCPHCGTLCGVYLKRQVIGWVVTRFDETGHLMDQSYDNISPGRAGIIRCSSCKEQRDDLELREEQVVPVN